jgi:hypothetical protein
MNNQEFLLSKINNLTNWLLSENLLSDDHKYIIKLKSFNDNIDSLYQYINILSMFADKEGNISDSEIIKYSGISPTQSQLNTFKKYINFFVKFSRSEI